MASNHRSRSINLTRPQASCLVAIRAGADTKTSIAIAAGLDLKGAAAALGALDRLRLVARGDGSRSWILAPAGRTRMIRIVPVERVRGGGVQSPRPGTAAEGMLRLLERPLRGTELARRLGVTLQCIHGLVVQQLAAGRIRIADPSRPLLMVARADDPALLLSHPHERVLSALPEPGAATADQLARVARRAPGRVASLVKELCAAGLVAPAGRVKRQQSYALTPVGARHVQRRARARRVVPRPIRLPVQSDRVREVLSHLATRGPSRTIQVGAALDIPGPSINALMQYLKRRGLACKSGRALFAPHAITARGIEVLAAMRPRRTPSEAAVGESG